jgi:hypothetical protein
MISRRAFLRLAVAAGGAALVAPELLLPKKTYFLPPANVYVIPGMVYADGFYKTYQGFEVITLDGRSFHEIVAKTLRKRLPEMVANVTQHNSLLERLRRHTGENRFFIGAANG